MTAPLSHRQEAQKLVAEGVIDLFEITLLGAPTLTRVYFKDGPTATWQSKTYESLACQLSGRQQSTSEERSRPKLVIMNPLGLWNTYVFGGYFEGSTIIHRRVLKPHLDSNTAISEDKYWRVSRVSNVVAGQTITLDLRSFMDGPSFAIPARRYMPDDGFPFVTI